MNPSEKWTRFSPDSLCSRVYLIITIIFNRAAFSGEGGRGCREGQSPPCWMCLENVGVAWGQVQCSTSYMYNYCKSTMSCVCIFNIKRLNN